MAWKEKVAGKINFEVEGMEVTGKIVEVKPTELGVNSYTLEVEGGDLVSFLGTTVLDRLLHDEMDSLVKIVYGGSVRTGRGFQVKQFAVSVWRDEAESPVTEALAEAESKSSKKR